MPGLPKGRCSNRFLIRLVAIFIIGFIVKPGHCEENAVDLTSFVKFTAGVVSAFMIHEGSHLLVAKATETDIDWEAGNYNQPLGFTADPDSDAKGVALYSAGLASQVIGSEIILQVDSINKNDAFVRGMMAWNIINPILYSLDYWFIRRSNQDNGNGFQGDIEGIEHYSNETTANVFALSMLAIASFQGYRFLKTQTWAPDWLKNENHRLNFMPQNAGGFCLTYEIHF